MSEKKKSKVRRVRVPAEEIQICTVACGPGPSAMFPFSYFMEFILRNGRVFRAGEDGGRLAANIDQAWRGRTKDDEGEYFDLEQRPQGQWQALTSAMKDTVVACPVPTQDILPYYDAIKDAEEVEVE